MSAAKSQKNSSIPADLQPYYNDTRSPARAWIQWIIRLVVLVILVCLVVMFVRWVWHQTHTVKHKPATSSSQRAPADQHSSGPITLGGSSESSTSSSSDTSNASNNSSTTTNPTTNGGNSASAVQSVGQSTKLANSGPGQTLGIFLASSLLFTVLYQLRLRVKTS